MDNGAGIGSHPTSTNSSFSCHNLDQCRKLKHRHELRELSTELSTPIGENLIWPSVSKKVLLLPTTYFGFDLNNREIAALIYSGFLLAAVMFWKKGRPLALDVVRAFFSPKLALIWVLMSLYVAGCVWLLAWLNLWDWSNLKLTLLWWLTVGFTCIFEAQRLKDKPHVLGKLVRDAFTLSAVILFVAKLVSFPLWVELLMLPALVFLTLLIAVGEHQTDKPSIPRVLNLLRGLQTFASLIILGFSYWLVVSSVTKFWSLNTLREFGLPLLLWLMFVPFIFLLAVYMTYEEAFIHLQVRPKQASIVRYARWRALLAFGWNIDGVKRLVRDMRGRDIADKQGVKDAIWEIKRLLKIEKNPPIVTRAEGWSPHAARLFLEEYGLVTDDYHRTQREWFAHIPLVKLNDNVLADRISYYLTGNERAVTQLWLALDGSSQNDAKEAQRAFDERALTLLVKAFDAERATTIYVRAQASEPQALVIDGIRVLLDRSDWGDSRLGGYVRNLTIQHPKHQGDN
ncbi:hypothetical protein SAMN05216417_103158 [Nitrosospira multiformis]|uniref:Uncharacterized protein n=1 Tax=Nitrosospira multiformis TaxID=1231 RepID=A0A1I7G432_9PROT|nr:hypothetical protein SAMN05216417_103158 [Nitrosospira multiformis]